MKRLKTPLTIRGDCLYCPLSLSLDTYWNCLCDCLHCYLRRLNRTWGTDLRPVEHELVERILTNGLKNKNPKTPLAHALAAKKTLRFGNKADPFQPAERIYLVSAEALRALKKLQWSFVIQTMVTDVMMDYERIIMNCRDFAWVQPIISPGLEKDWEILERKRTTNPIQRLEHLVALKKQGMRVAVNGEPFIPGFHTVKDFEDTCKLLRSYGIRRYNTYNFHFNDHVAKNMHEAGIDIRAIYENNQDGPWKKILVQLLDVAKKHNILLGCPDFVNTGPHYREMANTCCGVDVSDPMTFNTHTWKRMIQDGVPLEEIFESTKDGVGNEEEGRNVLFGMGPQGIYTMEDAGLVKNGRVLPQEE